MSNPWLPRQPALAALRPSLPAQTIAPQEISDWLLSACDMPKAVVHRLGTTATPPQGLYRVEGAAPVLIKVLNVEAARGQALGDAIASHAFNAGAAACAPLRSIDDIDGYTITTYPFLRARFGQCDPEDAALLGHELAALHSALKSFPERRHVRESGRARLGTLEQRRCRILEGQSVHEHLEDRHLELLKSFEFVGDDLLTNGQVVHGDLNLGNILFHEETKELTFIDFETASVTWLPAHYDVAMAVQRLCLTAECDEAVQMDSVKALLSSYYAASEGHGDAALLVHAMKWLSARNTCLLAELDSNGVPTSKQEWQKFAFLAALADEKSSTIEKAVGAIR